MIHTNGSQDTTGSSETVLSSDKKSGVVYSIDSDDEDKAEEKRTRFGCRLADFSFQPEKQSSYPSQEKMSKAKSEVKEAEDGLFLPKRISNTSPSSKSSQGEGGSLPPIKSSTMKDLPKLSESLVPILRSFVNCPLCAQPFPVLSLEEVVVKKKGKGKATKKRMKLAQTGADRLLHLEICAHHNDTSAELVMSLITKERIRLDRNQRDEYNEKVNQQGMWKTLTGDEPPSTQVQRDSIKRGRKRPAYLKDKGKGRAKEKKTAKGKGGKAKAVSSSVTFKAGKRGGLSRASTTILAPHLTRSEVKRKCVELFGPPERKTDDKREISDIWSLYEYHDENTRRFRAKTQKTIVYGLGVGACSRVKEEQDSNGAIARLGMGNTLGYTIAQRYTSSS